VNVTEPDRLLGVKLAEREPLPLLVDNESAHVLEIIVAAGLVVVMVSGQAFDPELPALV